MKVSIISDVITSNHLESKALLSCLHVLLNPLDKVETTLMLLHEKDGESLFPLVKELGFKNTQLFKTSKNKRIVKNADMIIFLTEDSSDFIKPYIEISKTLDKQVHCFKLTNAWCRYLTV